MGVAAFVVAAGSAFAGYAFHHPGMVTRTVTVTVPPKVVTRTVTRPVPAPTVTVTAESAQLQADNTCIAVLYQNIQEWKANGSIVPNGWWDTRCPVP